MAADVPAPEAFDALPLVPILYRRMNNDDDSKVRRSDVPVLRYAVLLGIIVFVGLIAAVVVGRNAQNARPTATGTSPSPGVSMGPTPRY